jgi:hypothetical protein
MSMAKAAVFALPLFLSATAFAQQPAPQAPNLAPLAVRWVKFVDPVEHAFSIDVPAGWRVSGGIKRMSTVDIRSGVEAISPDNTIDLFYGDPSIPVYTPPSPMLAAGGLGQGMTYSPGYGNQFLIEPYLNGEAFSAQWGQARVAKDCTNVRRTGARPRPDANQAIDTAYAQGGVRTSILAGESSFACNLRGMAGVGYVFAATELVQTQISSLWDVKSLVGFVAAAPRGNTAYMLLGHMVASFAVNPRWQIAQNQTAAQTSRIVAQQNAFISNAIIQNGRTLQSTSDMIVQGGAARSRATTNAIENYDQKAVRNSGTFTNPETGTTVYNLDTTQPYHFLDNSGVVHNSNSATAPAGSNWHPLQQVPAGQ